MFSGKSTELIRRLKRYEIARYECLIVKYANDTRYDATGIATHDRQTLHAVSATTLEQLKESAMQHDVIGVDEGQFVSFGFLSIICVFRSTMGLRYRYSFPTLWTSARRWPTSARL